VTVRVLDFRDCTSIRLLWLYEY